MLEFEKVFSIEDLPCLATSDASAEAASRGVEAQLSTPSALSATGVPGHGLFAPVRERRPAFPWWACRGALTLSLLSPQANATEKRLRVVGQELGFGLIYTHDAYDAARGKLVTHVELYETNTGTSTLL